MKRVSTLTAHLASGEKQEQEQIPLSAEQLATFLEDGYLLLEPPIDIGEQIHGATYAQAKKMAPAYGQSAGNNILPHIPELSKLLASPTIRGAVASVLGKDALLHRHRFMHTSSQQGDQNFHKDAMPGGRRMRSHRPRCSL